MQRINFKDKLDSSGNLLKIAVNDFVEMFHKFHDEMQTMKGEPLRPNRKTALALLEYISYEDSRVKETVEILSGQQLEKYFEWLDAYCKEYSCTQEHALKRIIEGTDKI